MIGTEQKSFEEILHMLKNIRSVGIVGCGDCAASCKTGGEDQVRDMAGRLQKEGKTIVHTGVVDVTCDKRLVKKYVREAGDKLVQAETILVMACGSGIQTVAECVDTKVIPALNSLFIGQIENLSKFYERCSVCGECVLADTGGICPVTRCGKGLINGPCGGSDKGKCEVDRENDCAWYLIYERMKKTGQSHIYTTVRKPKSNVPAHRPRKIEVRRHTRP